MGSGSTKPRIENKADVKNEKYAIHQPKSQMNSAIINLKNPDEEEMAVEEKDGESGMKELHKEDFVNTFKEYVDSCLNLFADDASSLGWLNPSGDAIISKLSRATLRHLKSKQSLTLDERQLLIPLTLETKLAEYFTDCLDYVLKNFPDVIQKDQSLIQSILDNTDDNKETFEKMLLCQRIICSVVGFFVNNVDLSEDYCSKCIECGTVDILLQYVVLYKAICKEDSKKVCEFIHVVRSNFKQDFELYS